jgi:hypothetical protein
VVNIGRVQHRRVRDIADNIDARGAFTAGMELEAFAADRKTLYAVVRALEKPPQTGHPHEFRRSGLCHTARRLASLIYRMLRRGQPYVDEGLAEYEKRYHADEFDSFVAHGRTARLPIVAGAPLQ